ncbi:DUF3231 family protein [Siminovitchia sediminis]|uniref:DUF3231 family protein n=1 Tax=Siminovitchia sediminis TaxID=1274353 RepID=A0ABW4KH45_9BACI
MFAKALVVASNQVAKSDKVKNFLQKAIKIKEDHVKMFSELLTTGNLPVPPLFEDGITNSTVSPFSEKLLVYQIGFLFSNAMVYYGTAWASSPRRDLTSLYMMVVMKDLKIGNDWIKLTIKNGRLEQPPLAADSSKLAK